MSLPDRRRHGLAAALITLAVVAGCTVGPSSRPDLAVFGGPTAAAATSSVGSRPTGPGGPGQQAELSPTWHDCDGATGGAPGAAVSCAGIQVPLDYAHPDNGTVGLAVGRVRAAGLAPDAPALVVMLNSGPLDATLATVGRLPQIAAALPPEITARYQIVGMDVRGSGTSNSTDCFKDYPTEYLFTLDADLTAARARTQLAEVTRAFTFGCQDYVGAGMIYFGTTQVADDLDSLRSALSADTLNLLGVGYGATAGAVYAHRYPGRVGRLVLDSPADHAAVPSDRAVNSATAYERSLQALIAECATLASCPLGRDPAATVNTAIGSLSFNNDRSPGGYLSSGTVLWALVLALPDHDRWVALALAIAGVARGDNQGLLDLMTALQKTPAAQLSSRLVLECNDSDERLAEADLTAKLIAAKASSATFGSFLVGLASVCRQWASADSPLGALRADGAPALLVVGGVNDPVAPYIGVESVANQLASATLISYLGTDHGGYQRSACVAGAVDTYLLDGRVPSTGTLCPA